MEKVCSIDGCGKGGLVRRGWCVAHYMRWRRHGDPLSTSYKGAGASFDSRVEPLAWSDCLAWVGAISRGGYGSFWADGKRVLAHRYAWTRANGEIPEGSEVDHVCHVRSCVNVDHMRLASRAENMRNQNGAHAGRKYNLPRGVYRAGRGYTAQVWCGGRSHYLGRFSTPGEASLAAQKKRDELFGEYAGRS